MWSVFVFGHDMRSLKSTEVVIFSRHRAKARDLPEPQFNITLAQVDHVSSRLYFYIPVPICTLFASAMLSH